MLILKRILKSVDKDSKDLIIAGTIRNIKFQLGMQRDISPNNAGGRNSKLYLQDFETNQKARSMFLPANAPNMKESGEPSLTDGHQRNNFPYLLTENAENKSYYTYVRELSFSNTVGLSQIKAPLYQIAIELSDRLGNQSDILKSLQQLRIAGDHTQAASREYVSAPLGVFQGIQSSSGSISAPGSNIKYARSLICAGILMDINLGFAPGNSGDPKKARDASLVLTFKDLRLENDFLEAIDMNLLKENKVNRSESFNNSKNPDSQNSKVRERKVK